VPVAVVVTAVVDADDGFEDAPVGAVAPPHPLRASAASRPSTTSGRRAEARDWNWTIGGESIICSETTEAPGS
jgi:hypothetical protein